MCSFCTPLLRQFRIEQRLEFKGNKERGHFEHSFNLEHIFRNVNIKHPPGPSIYKKTCTYFWQYCFTVLISTVLMLYFKLLFSHLLHIT